MTRKAPQSIWVLTREHNEYDQHGEYCVAAFSTRPSLAVLASTLSGHGYGSMHPTLMETVAFLEKLRAGGGRQGVEDVWFNLVQSDLIPGEAS